MDGIRALTPEPVHIIGFSAGSITGAQMATLYQENVLSVNIAGASSRGLPRGGLAGELHRMEKTMSRAEQVAVQAHNASLIMLQCKIEHGPHIVCVSRRHHHHVRKDSHVTNVKRSVVRGPIRTGQSRSIHHESDGKFL